MEYFDLVDENNKPLGVKKERSLVHADGDWHNTVHIYIFNDKDKLLVHLRSPFKDLHPNCWDTRFGGHVLAGESLEETLVKELEEEIGIKANTEDFIKGMSYKYDGGKNKEFNNVYYYKWRGEDLIFNDKEVVKVKWMTIEEILESLKKDFDEWTTRTETVTKVFDDWKKLK